MTSETIAEEETGHDYRQALDEVLRQVESESFL